MAECFWCRARSGVTGDPNDPPVPDYHPTCDNPACDNETHGFGSNGTTTMAYCDECRGDPR